MKKLSIEEKAKRYDEAIEKLHEIITMDNKPVNPKEIGEYLFPELRESEDEGIRKALVKAFNAYRDPNYEWGGMLTKDIIAWLEKQGEQKPTIEMKSAEESLGIDSETYNKIVDECIYGEQKPADKVEPKFKVGDFIANNYCFGKVVALTNDAYLLDTEQGIPFSCEHNTHLWTIQDAKNGDVLVNDTGCIFIYKNHLNNIVLRDYCHLATPGYILTENDNEGGYIHITNVYPATKEQCDTLFAKIKEAGYEWDAEKKELKKIKQKPVTIDIDKMVNDYANNNEHGNEEFGKPVGCMIRAYRQGLNDAIKKIEQKSTWSEEDDIMVHDIDYALRGQIIYPISKLQSMSIWINNLKDRVQLPPKQEWSKEDEINRDLLYKALNQVYDMAHNKDLSNWINKRILLCSQQQWNPSDEQIKQLGWVAEQNKDNMIGKELMSLYQDLKKLKG